MATVPVLLTEAEYLRTSYHPDCDYVDGLVLERNLGQHDHARLQAMILFLLMQQEKHWGMYVLPEQRLKIRPGKYRIPDVMVLSAGAPRTAVIEQPPLLCIEVVSPDDRMNDLIERARDYHALGVAETWILDPSGKQAYVYSADGLHEVNQLRFGQIALDLEELFGGL